MRIKPVIQERSDDVGAVARCERCGREFFVPPKDGIDHYYPANKALPVALMPTAETCGGRVLPLTKSAKR